MPVQRGITYMQSTVVVSKGTSTSKVGTHGFKVSLYLSEGDDWAPSLVCQGQEMKSLTLRTHS